MIHTPITHITFRLPLPHLQSPIPSTSSPFPPSTYLSSSTSPPHAPFPLHPPTAGRLFLLPDVPIHIDSDVYIHMKYIYIILSSFLNFSTHLYPINDHIFRHARDDNKENIKTHLSILSSFFLIIFLNICNKLHLHGNQKEKSNRKKDRQNIKE
jgi:hypothetical protein